MTDPYLDGVYRWWHLSAPSPELVEAEASGWLGSAGTAVDLGCGAGTEIGFLAAQGWCAVGVDLSRPALDVARREHADLHVAQADVLALPFSSGAFDLALDRGCFHYLSPARRADYAAGIRRVLRPDGRLLLRACLTSRDVRNDVTESAVADAFAGWAIDRLARADLPSDTRTMQALVIWLRSPPARSGPDSAGGLPRDRPQRAGDGPVPWSGSLPGPWFLARVLPEAQCQGGPKAISEGNAKRL